MQKLAVGGLAAIMALSMAAQSLTVRAQEQQEQKAQEWKGPANGPYFSLNGGASFLEDSGSHIRNRRFATEHDYGPTGLGAVGYRFGHFRLEGELSYRNNQIDDIGPPKQNGRGDFHTYAATGNVLFDFFPQSSITPYIGAGAGAARIYADDLRARGGSKIVDDHDTVFAYQGIGGMRFSLSPKWSVNTDYRYFRTLDPEFRTTRAFGRNKVEGDYENHAVTVGFTYHFGEPPKPVQAVQQPSPLPPPRPAPAPVAQPTPPPAPAAQEEIPVFIVFFAFDRADISPVAAQVLDRALEDYRRIGMVRFQIDGHADRSGSDVYNQRLSERRARAVAMYLMSKGIQPQQLTLRSFGESQPRVPTPDGVRNDENRRAEVTLVKL